MAGVARGEIRQVGPWPYTGNEASGGRPALVVSPDVFNSRGNAIVVPLTTPRPNHTHWWEPYISATDSRALAPNVRTVPVASLARHPRGIASRDDLHAVSNVLRRLIDGGEPALSDICHRGDVWQIAYPNQGERMDVLVLHYNESNGMAMTMVVTDRPRNPSAIILPVVSCPALSGRSVLASQVRSLSVGRRFQKRLGRLSATEVDAAAGAFMKLMP